jgi:hypothetical protein
MTGKKIKIALCLSGEPRSSMACYPYIYENLINLNPGVFEVDTYSYSFKGFRALPLYNCKKYVIDNRNDEEMFIQWLSPIKEKFHPKCVDLLFNTSNNVFNNQNGIKNLFLMYLNIHNCFNLIEEKYDIYIRARYDLIFQDRLFIENYITKIISKEVDLMVPQKSTISLENNPQEYNDQFAIGNYEGMFYYSNLINSLLSLINENITVKSEKILYEYLNSSNFKILKEFINLTLIRKSFINSYPTSPNFADQ